MKKTLGILTASALIASTALAPAAFAQNTTPATNPAAPGSVQMNTTSGDTTGTTTGAMGTTAATDTYLTRQGPDQVSASNFIGQNVYNSNNKSIGEINDLIMQKNGGIVAAVIGVGGFLGMGEKNVAVPMSKITVAQDTKNPSELHLTTTETSDSLKNAPEYKTLSEQQSNASGMKMPSLDNSSTSSTPSK
ncbi:PRC-barrel domain-containing protein [Allorhizobium sp. BGMRC 0089]|uniref:PRC-barrel domain-containing protein n=1 Tax=Allorhizobium sonneratiae TaxID=2934936 RepID=UPI0020332013|nr:PRC-barrel domain-containing protein [Allorhizobium sonneratiae]MCM2291311.1 PRC-barrel domain-containing protein [Allorhizobium sonneratiae]